MKVDEFSLDLIAVVKAPNLFASLRPIAINLYGIENWKTEEQSGPKYKANEKGKK